MKAENWYTAIDVATERLKRPPTMEEIYDVAREKFSAEMAAEDEARAVAGHKKSIRDAMRHLGDPPTAPQDTPEQGDLLSMLPGNPPHRYINAPAPDGSRSVVKYRHSTPLHREGAIDERETLIKRIQRQLADHRLKHQFAAMFKPAPDEPLEDTLKRARQYGYGNGGRSAAE